ncbi:MAG: rhodanese-like domain-containing protein [Armatimonadetes bacterium]|nr:rhodanese-like domain-containing protein [Armatimonadota bacterium]
MRNITVQRGGVFLALLLGFGLLIARGAPDASVAVEGAAVLKQVQAKDDHIDANTLAKWIIEGRKDYVLVDVRQPWEYDDYHVPGAVNVPMDKLLAPEGTAVLQREKTIVLCSSGGTHAAQAWVVLLQKGYRTKTLLDGVQGWWRDIMTPTCLRSTDEGTATAEYKAMKAVREHFQGGTASSGTPVVPDTSSPATPPAAPPTAPPSEPAKPAPGKAKGGGC